MVEFWAPLGTHVCEISVLLSCRLQWPMTFHVTAQVLEGLGSGSVKSVTARSSMTQILQMKTISMQQFNAAASWSGQVLWSGQGGRSFRPTTLTHTLHGTAIYAYTLTPLAPPPLA